MEKKYYLQPLGILRGCSASKACKSGVAMPLAGPALAFTTLKIIFRQGTDKRGEHIVSVARLGDYLEGLNENDRVQISHLLEKISASRDLSHLCAGDMAHIEQPLIQGILNVTPDSFSDGGNFQNIDTACSHAFTMIDAGADILDIGGESTRPGAEAVSLEQELMRVVSVVESLQDCPVPISVDSRNSGVMERALNAGATIINDITALEHDEKSLALMASLECPVILMHTLASPDVMQDRPEYDDVLLDVYDYLQGRIEACEAAGIDRARLVVDPGIGFGKNLEHNLALLAGLSLFHGLGVPILLGVSRKSFIAKASKGEDADQRLAGSLATAQVGYDQGVQVIRVHDVAETRQALKLWQEIGYNS